MGVPFLGFSAMTEKDKIQPDGNSPEQSGGPGDRSMIDAEGLTKNYGAVRAVDHVSFRIPAGQVFGLLGPNGAGKTTTIKMLTTLSIPDSGRCRIDGVEVAEDPRSVKVRIGVVPQENNLDRDLTAYENLQIYAWLHRVKRAPEEIQSMLRAVDLWERKDSVVNHFSGGMQRRLLLARALLPKPLVLFLDEPSIGLDPQIRRQMWDMIRKTKIEGRTIVLTTHYIEEAEALCDRVGILARGRLIALDTPRNLKAIVGEYVVEFINPEGRLLQQICRDPEEAHALARQRENGVTIRKTNLEDVFIKLTGERIE
jgi:ABC-2 type transport system ATP-binding protein